MLGGPGDCVASERVERKLAAILAADVAGYSRLAGADAERTLARLRALRALRALIDPAIAAHHSRVVKRTGDGVISRRPASQQVLGPVPGR
jgi:adenylate cyclase